MCFTVVVMGVDYNTAFICSMTRYSYSARTISKMSVLSCITVVPKKAVFGVHVSFCSWSTRAYKYCR